MTRSQGKKTSRVPDSWPATGEEADIGYSNRRAQGEPSPIPGGRDHIVNAPAHRQNVPIGAPRPEIRGENAHGVMPGTHTTRERADVMRGINGKTPVLHTVAPVEPIAPVPVYLVEAGGGEQVLRSAAPHAVTLPTNAGEPVRLCGRDLRRVAVLLMNEDDTNGARFAQRPSDLTNGGGGLLHKAMTSYQRIHTQDELWGICDNGTGTPKVSIVQEFEQDFS